jgi:hypothetical protein
MLVNITTTQSAFPARFFVSDIYNEISSMTNPTNAISYINVSMLRLTQMEALEYFGSLTKPTFGYTAVPANLTIDVLKPLDLSERFRGFWDVWGQPISLIAGGFAAGVASLTFDRIKKRK